MAPILYVNTAHTLLDVVLTLVDDVVGDAQLTHHGGGCPTQVMRGPAPTRQSQRIDGFGSVFHGLISTPLTVRQLLSERFDADRPRATTVGEHPRNRLVGKGIRFAESGKFELLS